jgi:1-deoxy-D-xylulose-5-phosphate synthase
VSAAVVNARFVKPLDAERLIALARRCGAVLTVEEASGMGGFGGAVLEALAASGVAVAARCLAVPDRLIEHGSSPSELGLDAHGIVRAALELVAGKS